MGGAPQTAGKEEREVLPSATGDGKGRKGGGGGVSEREVSEKLS